MRAKSTFKISYVYYRRGGLQIHKDKLLVVAPNPRSADQLLAQLLALLRRYCFSPLSQLCVKAPHSHAVVGLLPFIVLVKYGYTFQFP